jgi:beta-N-acetylhexosaminidase
VYPSDGKRAGLFGGDKMSIKPVILGCESTTLSKNEKFFMRDANPWGYILFARNIDTPLQVQRLVYDLRNAVGRDAAVFIDQEGGRVARLKQPYWNEWTPVGDLIAQIDADGKSRGKNTEVREHEIEQALTDRYRVIGQELRALGIDVNCVPLLDVPQPGADNIIGDRALGTEPELVASRAGRGVAHN